MEKTDYGQFSFVFSDISFINKKVQIYVLRWSRIKKKSFSKMFLKFNFTAKYLWGRLIMCILHISRNLTEPYWSLVSLCPCTHVLGCTLHIQIIVLQTFSNILILFFSLYSCYICSITSIINHSLLKSPSFSNRTFKSVYDEILQKTANFLYPAIPILKFVGVPKRNWVHAIRESEDPLWQMQ